MAEIPSFVRPWLVFLEAARLCPKAEQPQSTGRNCTSHGSLRFSRSDKGTAECSLYKVTSLAR